MAAGGDHFVLEVRAASVTAALYLWVGRSGLCARGSVVSCHHEQLKVAGLGIDKGQSTVICYSLGLSIAWLWASPAYHAEDCLPAIGRRGNDQATEK